MNNPRDSKKGSVWRKWDFHVHTPSSYIETSFGNDWDDYVFKLVEAATREDIWAIGITDYFSIEGYKTLKHEYFSNSTKLQALFKDRKDLLDRASALYLFPNIEFRLNTFVGDNSVNYHVIFSDEVKPEDIEEYFLGEVSFLYSARPQDESLKMKLKKANLEALGARIKTDQQNISGTDLAIGLKSAVVDLENIKSVLLSNSARFEGKYLLGFPPDEDLSEVRWDGRDGDTRRQIVRGADFLLAANPSTREWACAKKQSQKKDEFLTEFGGLKPCIWGSDSHSFNNFLRPDQERFCWIKADLNFQGLLQIKYEPEGRIALSATKPDEKVPYYTLEKIRFRDGPEPTFSTDWIEINPNLTTIIGGKSSGKSLLLYYLAKTISPVEAEKLKAPGGKAPYDCETNQNFDFEVMWTDGEINRLRQRLEERQKKITYLPQLYINSLVEGKSRKELNRLIEDVLLENEAYATERGRFNTNCRHVDGEIEGCISSLFSLLDQKSKLIESCAKLGDKQAHIKQIEALKHKIGELTKDSSLSDLEKEEFRLLREKHKEETDKIKSLRVDAEHLQALNARFSEINATTIMEDHVSNYGVDCSSQDVPSPRFAAVLERAMQTATGQAITSFKAISNSLTQESAQLTAEMSKTDEALKALLVKLQPYAGKFKNREELAKQESQLKQQTVVLEQIEAIEKKINEVTSDASTVKGKIWDQRAKYREIYQNFVDFIKSIGLDKIADDINLLVEMKFDEDDFHRSVIDSVNLTSLKKAFPEDYDESSQHLNRVTIETFKILLEGILSIDIKLKAGVKRDDLLRRLLRNYLTLGFNLKHKGDDLFKMSPGKRGIVVLKVLLHLSNSRDPILIDQPEDNLDNRTIYEELNSFIQEKKKLRQIVMVTHNANLVVATDAEEVIVCNQGGQTPGRDNKAFTFEYVSGPLENAFIDPTQTGVLFQKGIKEHVCEVLEGGKEAFKSRQMKYNLN